MALLKNKKLSSVEMITPWIWNKVQQITDQVNTSVAMQGELWMTPKQSKLYIYAYYDAY